MGFLLSGGLDSSLVCAIAQKLMPDKPICTFAIGMSEDAIDLKYPKEAADFIGSDHTEFIITKEDVLESLETVIEILGTYDITTIRASMGMYLLCKRSRETTDVRVLLTGEISDELFGYKYTDFAPDADAFQEESAKRIRELHMYDVLRADRCISANSIEARVPFGDLDFVRTVMAIDPAKKINTYGKGKYLLRKAFEGDYLPIIVTLFFFLSMMEDSGYIARVAFFMDKLLRKIGLSGRSIVPLLIGFGCTVPAVMATRTLPSERDRKMTILLTPFMSCTAKLPIYAFFVSAFFPGKGGLIMAGLYITGIVIGILVALLFKGTLFKGEAVPFVMELPNYRLPGAKNVAQLLWEKAKDFLQRAFSVILIATVVIWFLQSFDLRFNMVEDSSKSILAMIAGWIAPIFAPIGLGDWRIVTSLISGFMAKESVVSTLQVLFHGGVQSVLTSLSAASLLVFSLLYTPCVAAIASVRREMGRHWAIGVVLWQCAIAWVAAAIVRVIGLLIF